MKASYGITHEEYEAMAEAQDRRCKLCDERPEGEQRLHVDHCHETGRVRGLLCFPCNNLLGRVERLGLHRVVAYLTD